VGHSKERKKKRRRRALDGKRLGIGAPVDDEPLLLKLERHVTADTTRHFTKKMDYIRKSSLDTMEKEKKERGEATRKPRSRITIPEKEKNSPQRKRTIRISKNR